MHLSNLFEQAGNSVCVISCTFELKNLNPLNKKKKNEVNEKDLMNEDIYINDEIEDDDLGYVEDDENDDQFN